MRILIVDDEPVHARYLSGQLQAILGREIESLQVQRTLTAAECFITDNAIDLLFLDLNLFGRDGFDLLRGLQVASFSTIVVSAHTDMAVRAFEFGVLDFIPKPVKVERVELAIKRYRQALSGARPLRKYFSFYSDGGVEQVPLDQILFFQSSGKSLLIHCKTGEVKSCSRQIGSVEKTLPPHFKRIQKSYIVDVRSIRSLVAGGGGHYQAILEGGRLLPVSRRVYAELKASMVAPSRQ